ncbi:TAXI family TRAP transporter solute-binding subunit [Aquibaculum sediminis]|uniref:TAXI family TRAP transporter solute-binding subunit n=1 Tax=Aquibaculum sediminis TaxID=3231907 RepID=UPI00345496BD
MNKSKLLAATVVAGLGMGLAGTADAQQLRFMTGPQGGSWYPLGGAIQNMATESLGANMIVMPGGGVANVQGVQNGDADFGFGNSISTVDAVNGREPFEGPTDNVCNLATLYPQYFQMVVTQDSGITSPEDYEGRRLVTQPVGNTAEQVIRMVLDVAGLSYDDMRGVDYVSYSDGVALLQDGNADIFTLGTTVPASSIMDLANSRNISLVSLDDDFIAEMIERNPGFSKLTIPAGSYPGQDEDATVAGYATHLIVRCDVDEELVYGLMNEIWENREDLEAIAGAMRGLTIEQMGADNGVPMHAGALRFYEENGVTY